MIRELCLYLSLLSVAALGFSAGPLVRDSAAQTVQLPTFQFFTVSTTVTVPDGGEVLLGGVMRLSEGRNDRGTPIIGNLPGVGRPFRNVGIGRQVSSSLSSVKVHIHDFEAMEEKLLGEARRNGRLSDARLRDGRRDAQPWNHRGQPQVAAAPKYESRRRPTEREEMADLLSRARRAEVKGKPHIAKIYYRILARQGTGSLQQLAAAKMDQFAGTTARNSAERN